MNYGVDNSIFANGLPDLGINLPTGSQPVSSKPALDLTLSQITNRDVLLQDLYKLQFTPPEYLFWSTDSSGQPNPITVNIPDLLGDTVDAPTLSQLAATLETLIVADARYVDAVVTMTQPAGLAGPVVISEQVLPTDGTQPIELVVNVTGSNVTLVRVS